MVKYNGKVALDFNDDKLHAPFTYSVTAMALIGVGEFSDSGDRFLGQLPQGVTRDWQGDRYRLIRSGSNLVSDRNGYLSPVATQLALEFLAQLFTLVGGNYLRRCNSGASATNTLNATYTKLLIRSNNSGPISECMDGKMQEVLLYTSNKSSVRTDIEENIGDYFTQNTHCSTRIQVRRRRTL